MAVTRGNVLEYYIYIKEHVSTIVDTWNCLVRQNPQAFEIIDIPNIYIISLHDGHLLINLISGALYHCSPPNEDSSTLYSPFVK